MVERRYRKPQVGGSTPLLGSLKYSAWYNESMNAKHILPKLDKVIAILKKNGVTKAAVFGSYARGEQTKKSDIDLLVELPEEMSLFGVIRLKLELEEVLKRKVDLVEYDCIKPVIRESVLSAQVPVI